MIIDIKAIKESQTFQTDICILGGGIAGITLAKELSSTNKNIIVLDAGSETYDQQTQDLYQAESKPKIFPPTSSSRLRFLGGSSNHWENSVERFDPIDFKKREWVEQSGWPINYEDVEKDGKNISIQGGVNGQPWFQLSAKYSSPAQVEKIHKQAINALNQLHQAISSSPDWVTSIHPGNELRRCYQQCIDADVILPLETKAKVEQLAKHLDELGELSAFPQHGDYCINNLIFDNDNIHIIDFEDFGKSTMPFHDQFTLALSFHQLSTASLHISLKTALDKCLSVTTIQHGLDSAHLSGLFLHHLLLRLGSWSQNRLEYRKWLLSVLKDFNTSPDNFF